MSATAAEYNAQVIDQFRGNEGRVGGIWDGTRCCCCTTPARGRVRAE